MGSRDLASESDGFTRQHISQRTGGLWPPRVV